MRYTGMTRNVRRRLASGAAFPVAVLVIAALVTLWVAVWSMADARAADGWTAVLAWVGIGFLLVIGLFSAVLAVGVAMGPSPTRRAAPTELQPTGSRGRRHPARHTGGEATGQQSSQHTADDAVNALRAVARILLASPNSTMPPEWARTQAAYFQDMAEAVIRESGLDRARIDTGANYVGHDWESALIPILFPDEQVEHVATRVRDV